MLTAAVIGLLATPTSGAAPSSSQPPTAAPVHSERTDESAGQSGSARTSGSLPGGAKADDSPGRAAVRSDSCPSARKALTFYRSRVEFWRAKMGAGESRDPGLRESSGAPCPRIRYLAERWQRKAHAARVAFTRWHFEQYAWRSWLPPVWKRLIACETFSNFRHDSGTYQGAFGFHYGSWDRFKLLGYPADAFDATPREQYEVALAIWRRFGFSGWGCANG